MGVMKIWKRKVTLVLSSLLILLCGSAKGQDVAVKTNVMSDALLNINLGMEFGLAPRWTLNLAGQYNGWTVNERKWKHWLVQPEARYWFCDRFAGHFMGVHALGGQYNFANIKNGISFLGSDFSALTDYRYQGWAVGCGIAYGYAWILGRHWNLEAEIGMGYIYTRYDKFECKNCGRKLEKDKSHNYVGPTKAAINLVYLF